MKPQRDRARNNVEVTNPTLILISRVRGFLCKKETFTNAYRTPFEIQWHQQLSRNLITRLFEASTHAYYHHHHPSTATSSEIADGTRPESYTSSINNHEVAASILAGLFNSAAVHRIRIIPPLNLPRRMPLYIQKEDKGTKFWHT